MKQRMDHGRLGFVLGAGVSKQAGVPLWRGLISRLFEHYGKEGAPESYKKDTYPATLVAQFIFNRFQMAETRLHAFEKDPRIVPIAVRNSWYRKIHDAIYQDVPSISDVAERHLYLLELAYLVREAPFTLSLNFDDILDRLAQALIVPGSQKQIPNIIWKPPTVDRTNSAVIYHVNGFLPHDKGAKRSESIVLTEDSFASLMASPSPVETEYVMGRVVSNTMLVVGASFEDPSLRNLFYISARRNPAGFHYCLQHDEDVTLENVSSDERRDRADLNRNMYNIVTYFVTSSEISSIVRLLSLPENRFSEAINEMAAETGAETTYRYYVVGAVSSGKSSLVERLRTFRTYEEWGEPPLELMFRDPESLDDGEREQVDEWVLSQLVLKNEALVSPRYGVHVMDRAPLDMFAFSKRDDENPPKAKKLHNKLGRRPVQEGEIIFLQASEVVLFERQLRRGRGPEWLSDAAYKPENLARQTQRLKAVYTTGMVLDTSQLSQDDVAREVAEQILFGNYSPANLEEARKRIAEGT